MRGMFADLLIRLCAAAGGHRGPMGECSRLCVAGNVMPSAVSSPDHRQGHCPEQGLDVQAARVRASRRLPAPNLASAERGRPIRPRGPGSSWLSRLRRAVWCPESPKQTRRGPKLQDQDLVAVGVVSTAEPWTASPGDRSCPARWAGGLDHCWDVVPTTSWCKHC